MIRVFGTWFIFSDDHVANLEANQNKKKQAVPQDKR